MAATNQLAAIFVSGLSILFLFHVERIRKFKIDFRHTPSPYGYSLYLRGRILFNYTLIFYWKLFNSSSKLEEVSL